MKCFVCVITVPIVDTITWGEKLKSDGSKREAGRLVRGSFMGVVDGVGYSFSASDRKEEALLALRAVKPGDECEVNFDSLKPGVVPEVNVVELVIQPKKSK